MRFPSLLLLPCLLTSVTAFAPHQMPTTTIRRTHAVRPLHVVSPEHLADLSTALSQHSDWLPSHLLADAAAAAATDDGWWNAYLNIFKNTLLAVHTTIDQPLRSVGIDQTWGVSIAIFTASECYDRIIV